MVKLKGMQLIKIERLRQMDTEGWSSRHDDELGSDVLELAAFCYRAATGSESPMPGQWPFDAKQWKPKTRDRNLERAGALYLAAADVSERARDYRRRNDLNVHVESCATLLDSVLTAESC